MKNRLIIHGDSCFAVIRNFGQADQSCMHEFMPDDNGIFYDNEGHSNLTFKDKIELTKFITSNWPGIEISLKKNRWILQKSFSI